MMTDRNTGPVIAAIVLLLLASDATAEKTDGDAAVVEVPGATIGRFGESATVDADSFEFSQAENQVWMADHLSNIDRPARLYYEFKKSGSYESGFSDSVFLDIVKINDDGTRDTDMEFFTGERTQPFGPNNVLSVRGNPVIGLYMRGDVFDMNRLTEGSWRYFQRRIKLALAESASIEPVEIRFGNQTLRGRKIVITPYANDPRRGQFAQFASKRYEFTFSDEIPGRLYEIHTIIPGAGDSAAPLIEERLTLKEVDFSG